MSENVTQQVCTEPLYIYNMQYLFYITNGSNNVPVHLGLRLLYLLSVNAGMVNGNTLRIHREHPLFF